MSAFFSGGIMNAVLKPLGSWPFDVDWLKKVNQERYSDIDDGFQ